MKKTIISALFCASCLLNASQAFCTPKIMNCSIKPDVIGINDEVTVSFNYEDVEGGLNNAKILLIQRIKFPNSDKTIERTSNWQRFLENTKDYKAENGSFERMFINLNKWEGPVFDLIYDIKIIDKNGKQSQPCSTTIRPKKSD